jgi:hypothetical protein
MNEHELTRHFAAHAATVEPTADADGLRKRMVRVDRSRRVRTVGAAGSMAAIAAFGFLSLGGGNQSTGELDVGGQVPTPVPSDPDLVPGTIEQPGEELAGDADEGAGVDSESGSETSSVPLADPAADPPDYLATASTTTVVPAVVSTTVPTSTLAPAPITVPPSSTAAPATFSASPRYGSCEEDPPYDEYSGVAAPGATITITSPHSSPAQTVADDSGHWFLRVEFPSAPVKSPFTVTAGDGSTSVSMSFERLA